MDRMLCLAACFALCGCSILLDSNDHQGGRARDSAVTDTSFDGGAELDGGAEGDAQVECNPIPPAENIPWRTCSEEACSVCPLSTNWLNNEILGQVFNSQFSMEINQSPPPDAELAVYIAYLLYEPFVFPIPNPVVIDALVSGPQEGYDLVDLAREEGATEMESYSSVAIGAITEERLGFVVTGVATSPDEPSVWVGFAGPEQELIALNPSSETGTVFGRAAVTLGGFEPRAYWRERNVNDVFFLGSVDMETGASESFRSHSGSLVNETADNIEVVGSPGDLIVTEGPTSGSVILWNGDGGEPAEISTPNRKSPPAMTYLGDDSYFVAWLEDTSPVKLHALELHCDSRCAGTTCTRTNCCPARTNELELDPLAPDSIAAHALPGGGVVVVADEGQGQHSTVHLMFLDDELELVRVGDSPTYPAMASLAGVDTVKSFQVGIIEGETASSFTIVVAVALGELDARDAMTVQVATVSVCK